MLEQEQHILPVDLLFDDEQIGDFVKSIQIDSPYQQMVLEGVLTESVREEKLLVSFAVEGYFHYVLGEVIYNQKNGKGPETLKQIVEENKLNGAKEGVEECLIRDVQKDELTRLMWLIDAGEEMLKLCVIPLLYSLKFLGTKITIEKILENSTENDWKVLFELDKRLDNLQLHFLRKEFLNLAIIQNKFQTKDSVWLGLKAIEILDKKESLDYLNLIENCKENFFDDDIYNALGKAYQKLAEFSKSIIYFEKCLSFKLKKKIKNHPSLAVIFNNIGQLYTKKGDYINAISSFQKSLKVIISYYGVNSILVADIYNNIAFTYFSKREYNNSVVYFEKSLKIYEMKVGINTKEVATILNNLGLVFNALKDYSKAMEYHNKSLLIRINLFGENNYNVGFSYNNIGSVYYRKGFYRESIIYFEKNLNILKTHFGKNHPETATCYNNIGVIYRLLNDNKNAVKCSKKALTIKTKYFGNLHTEVSKASSNLGKAYKSENEYINAVKYLKKSLKINVKIFGNKNIVLLHDLIDLAECYEIINEKEKALDYYIQSAEIRKDDIGLDDEATQESIANAKRLAKELNKESDLPEWMK
jgi:tetratricopeptide (TPR) repeat protein